MTGPLPAKNGSSGRVERSGQPQPFPPSGKHDAASPAPKSSFRTLFANPRTGPARWVLALAMMGAIMGASLSLSGVLTNFAWWPQAAVVVFCTLLPPAIMRRYPALDNFAPLGTVTGWFLGLTLVFFPGTAILGIFPTLTTVSAASDLAQEASLVIATSLAPVPSVPAMAFLFSAGLGFVALLIDTLAIAVSMPAASSLGFLLIMLPASLTTRAGVGFWGFLGAAAGFLLILGCCRWYAPDGCLRTGSGAIATGTLGRAAGLGAIVVTLMLVVTAIIPGFDTGFFPQGARLNNGGGTTSLDPMITLGESLREQSGEVNLSYLSTSPGPQYLRMSTLEDFTGKTWGPSRTPDGLKPGLTGLAPAAGPAPSVPITDTLTLIKVENLRSDWLPAPLSPTSIENLQGDWLWNPSTQTIKRSAGDTTANQSYLVRSSMPDLSRPELAQAQGPATNLDPVYSNLPGNVPTIVSKTAQEVGAGLTSPYAKAMAIQDYLRSPDFVYSLTTPASDGYDGSGMDVLEKFLEKKSGYCVHYSAAMAVMARELGIPSRIAIGYAPGERTTATGSVDGQDLRGYQVTGRDAHSWPELYFSGLGWVPFEPTPSRGDVPTYAREDVAPATTAPEELNPTSAPTTAASTATATPSATAVAGPGNDSARVDLRRWLNGLGLVLLGLAVLLMPAGGRVLARRIRLAQIRGKFGRLGNHALPSDLAWTEVLLTADDFRIRSRGTETPRMFSYTLASALTGPRPPELDFLLESYEQQTFGGSADVSSQDREQLALAVQELITQMRASASPWRRLWAWFLPVSSLKYVVQLSSLARD